MKIRLIFKKIGKKISDYFKDENGGNLVEYALLLGFALFIFFILVAVITSTLDWTLGQSNEFYETVEGLNG